MSPMCSRRIIGSHRPRVIQFCTRHSLSLSVKAGGYGTHGQAVQGDVIVDISLLSDIHIENANEQGGFTSIRDMRSSRNAGKSREVDDSCPESRDCPLATDFLSPPQAKRRADEAFNRDEQPWPTTFQTLAFSSIPSPSGSGLPASERGAPHPKNRRKTSPPDASSQRLHPSLATVMNNIPSFSTSGQSGEGSRLRSPRPGAGEDSSKNHPGVSGSESLPGQRAETVSSAATTTHLGSPQRESQAEPFSYMATQDPPASVAIDPFGYMAGEDSSATQLPVPAALSSSDSPTSLAQPGPANSFSMNMMSSSGHYMPTRVNPISPHAYVTFGAGAKQKDVDQHSASHPLPATSMEGIPCYTPYHVPFSAHPVGGSVMLLGGFGFLSRLHGLSIDNLVEVEMVLADGSIVLVNENEHPGEITIVMIPIRY